MKIKITLKDPDGVYDSIQSAAEDSAKSVECLDADERMELIERRRDSLNAACAKWVKYSEYVTITIDTEAGTATVDPVTQ